MSHKVNHSHPQPPPLIPDNQRLQLTCTCGPFECSCRWRSEHSTESYAAAAWSHSETQSYAAYAPPVHTAASLPPQQHYDPQTLPSEDIFHPEEIFQLDQPIRLDFPMEESTLESPPTFADLNGDNSRPEDAYWLEWQRAAGSDSSETPSPEIFGSAYQQSEAYCEQQSYIPQVYYPDDCQYYPIESTRNSPITNMHEQRFYRYDQDCTQTNIDMQAWNYSDCAFTPNDVSECKQYFDVQHQQAVNAFSSLL
ncbi:hypothetical protein O3G_MSEX000067 [Manduca sexta]|nr:hypothetical protein O3G_MSEX000067 [Manduca sexta]